MADKNTSMETNTSETITKEGLMARENTFGKTATFTKANSKMVWDLGTENGPTQTKLSTKDNLQTILNTVKENKYLPMEISTRVSITRAKRLMAITSRQPQEKLKKSRLRKRGHPKMSKK